MGKRTYGGKLPRAENPMANTSHKGVDSHKSSRETLLFLSSESSVKPSAMSPHIPELHQCQSMLTDTADTGIIDDQVISWCMLL